MLLFITEVAVRHSYAMISILILVHYLRKLLASVSKSLSSFQKPLARNSPPYIPDVKLRYLCYLCTINTFAFKAYELVINITFKIPTCMLIRLKYFHIQITFLFHITQRLQLLYNSGTVPTHVHAHITS